MKKREQEKYLFNKKCLLILLYLYYLNDVSYKSIVFRSFGFHFDPKCNFKVIVYSSHDHVHKYVVHIYESLNRVNLEELDELGNVNFFKVKNLKNIEFYEPETSLNIYYDEANFLALGYIEGKKIKYCLRKDEESIFNDDLLYLLNKNDKKGEDSFLVFLLKLFTYRLPIDLVLGAGLNTEYGAKDWKNLVSSLNTKFYEGSEDRIDEIKHYVGDELFVTSKVFKTSGFDTYKELNKELYLFKENPDFNVSNTNLVAIADFIQKHSHTDIITYNYDTNLEYLLKKRDILYNTVYDDNAFLNKFSKADIFHVHGLLPFEKEKENKFTDSLIFNESEYYYLYNNPYSWNISKQLHDFVFNECVFIGISLTDPNMKRLLELASNYMKFNFIFMKKEEGMSEKTYRDVTNYFFTYDLITIWIDEYKEIKNWLDKID